MDAIQDKFAIVEREFEGVTVYVEDVYLLIAAHIKAGQPLAAQIIAERMAEEHHQNEGSDAEINGDYSVILLEAMRGAFFPELQAGEVTLSEYTAFLRQAEIVASLLLVLALRKKTDGRT